MSNFEPPVAESFVSEEHLSAEGAPERITLIVTDAAGNDFGLTIVTRRLFEVELVNGITEGEYTDHNNAEPVFVAPQDVIDNNLIEQVLRMPPNLLGSFLIEQSVQSDAA